MCFFANTLFIMRYKGTRHVSIIKHFILILTQLHFEKYVKITLTTESMMPPQKIHFVRTLRRISKFIARLQMIDTQTLSQTQRTPRQVFDMLQYFSKIVLLFYNSFEFTICRYSQYYKCKHKFFCLKTFMLLNSNMFSNNLLFH